MAGAALCRVMPASFAFRPGPTIASARLPRAAPREATPAQADRAIARGIPVDAAIKARQPLRTTLSRFLQSCPNRIAASPSAPYGVNRAGACACHPRFLLLCANVRVLLLRRLNAPREIAVAVALAPAGALFVSTPRERALSSAGPGARVLPASGLLGAGPTSRFLLAHRLSTAGLDTRALAWASFAAAAALQRFTAAVSLPRGPMPRARGHAQRTKRRRPHGARALRVAKLRAVPLLVGPRFWSAPA